MEEYSKYWENLDRYALRHVSGSQKVLSNYCIYDLEDEFSKIEIQDSELNMIVLKKMEEMGATKKVITWRKPLLKILYYFDRIWGRY